MIQPWHALEIDEVELALSSDKTQGLTELEARLRLLSSGPNLLPRGKRQSALIRFLKQFNNPLIYVLLAAGLGTLWLEDYIDSVVIFAVVLINALIAFIQEGKAEQALDAVRELLAPKAIVIRSGKRIEVDARDLVPGDLVVLEAGDQVPADIRLVRAHALQLVEASLTGESQPTSKHVGTLAAAADLAERSNLAYAGTQVATGQGRGLVVATATETELGKIGTLVETVPQLQTPLTKRLDVVAGQITWAVLILGVATFGYGYLLASYELPELFLAVIGLAVAAIPEGLPAVVTIALALTTSLMTKSRAVIRKLPAVETLGSVSVICTDKTGTLTKNEMTVVQVMLRSGDLEISGAGYDPSEKIPFLPNDILPLLEAAVLCNHAQLRKTELGYIAIGDPTEAALVTLGEKALVTKQDLGYEFLDELPFDANHRYMATLAGKSGIARVFVKGAPEELFEICELNASEREFWSSKVATNAAKGSRLLAFAGAEVSGQQKMAVGELPKLEFFGMVAIVDPPRPEAIQAIAECQGAGIAVKMITGDHLATAAAIAKELGLNSGRPLAGSEIDALDDKALALRLSETDVVARANPSHKLRLVQILQAGGQLVAMTGDGVNDAPALQAADLGVAMGKKGTEAAKQASDMVLTDDSFETISKAVKQGRVVYDNIKKALMFMLATDLGEAAIILAAVLFGVVLPITAGQILWINLVTAVTLAFALLVERAEPGIMQRGPNPAKAPILNLQALWRMALVAGLMVAATFWIFERELARGAELEVARTAAVTMVVIAEIAYLINIRSFTESAFSRPISRVTVLVVGILTLLQLGFVYLPQANLVFASRPIGFDSWVDILLVSIGLFFIIELEKLIRRKFVSRGF